MAQVVITLIDDKSYVVMDVLFQPALDDDMTQAQDLALKMLNWFDGQQITANREALRAILYPRPEVPLQ